MDHAHLGNYGPLQRLLLALVLAVTWCGVSMASNGWHGHDQVTISGTPDASVTAGQAYSFTPSATDSAGRTLVFAIANPPPWATFSTSSGQLSGTPSATDVGPYSNIVIAVSDGYRTATLPAFTVQVLSGTTSPPPPPPPAPTISGTPPTTDVAGSAYAFQPSASGPSGMTLSFSVQNLPGWAKFSTATGLLSGTPSSTQTGTYSNIVVSVSDGQASSALAPFNITVTAPAPPPPPPAPTISGTPASSVIAGNSYAFQPSASGPSGMTLSFSVQNKPSWATFSIASGMLSGTPSSTQTGTYSNIVLSVSDGQASSALPAFAITVSASTPTTGSATVAVTPPTQNTDGSTLTDLAGVTIYYGTSPTKLSQSMQVANPQPASYTISNLAAGTWYFGGMAYTTTGMQSAMSAIVSTTIQ